MATSEKPVMVIGVDDSEESTHALEWALDLFFAPYAPNFHFDLVVVHAKPSPISVVGIAGPGSGQALPYIESDLKKIAARVIEQAKEMCISKSAHGARLEVVEGDARNVLCDAVEKHHASVLVVGSHGYGAIKRAVLGSVSDYCAHHAHCNVMIVKKPKTKH
ncbi:hypothetical protein RHMOL_Rhmol01G0377200 [Rhododendron molle]|uniref:Uncharacterized protein n=1 Tax=Rhododendron molle TaxID=49168 RepID=A0ACC0Q9J5_RHOML|nr:hypothetical protein RHMOL_Rhmol01G0377200 [Rhododendron molle]